MITADGWFSWAIHDPGPTWKVNGGRNDCKGVVPHSAEGYWPHLRDLLWDQGRQASWGASNLADGRFVQHYPVYAQTWTSGAGYPNNHFFAFENEGVAGVVLTDAQVANVVRVIAELSAAFGWQPRRPANRYDTAATLYEHNECTRWGAEPTACPSGRIPWPRVLVALKPQEEDEDMPYRVWCPEEQRTYLIGPQGARPIVDPLEDKQLEKDLGPHKAAYSRTTLKKIGVVA